MNTKRIILKSSVNNIGGYKKPSNCSQSETPHLKKTNSSQSKTYQMLSVPNQTQCSQTLKRLNALKSKHD